jgi:hypothetical protein
MFANGEIPIIGVELPASCGLLAVSRNKHPLNQSMCSYVLC